MKIVFNSSPLIFLSRLDYLEQFLTTDFQFYLPESVQVEINAKQDQVSNDIQNFINNEKLIVKNVNLFTLAQRLNEHLGKGESDI